MDPSSGSLAPWPLLEHMTESVLVTTPDLDLPGPSILYVNPAFEHMTGWSRDEVLGKSPRLLQGPKTDLTVFADLRQRLGCGQRWRGQTVNYRKDGSEFVMEWSIVPLADERGDVYCHLAVQRDVTERVTLEGHLAAARAEEQKWLKKLEDTNRELRQLNEEQQRTLNLFVKYVPDAVVRRGLEAGEGSLFHGEQLQVALLFCDLRGFTRVSESLSPRGVVTLLNTYYRMMSEVIALHEGVVNQFVGDEIFVTFGAPLPVRDSTEKAARCALAMVERMGEINSSLQAVIGEPIFVGIGVHYGPVVAGNLGSETQLSYSITGDAVNTAKRIESLAPAGGNTILLSDAALGQLRSQAAILPWPPARVKGKENPVAIHQLTALDEDRSPP